MKKYIEGSTSYTWESVEDYSYEVEEELGIEVDVPPSTVHIGDMESGDVTSLDYSEFVSAVFDFAMSSSNPEEFKAKYSNYLKTLF